METLKELIEASKRVVTERFTASGLATKGPVLLVGVLYALLDSSATQFCRIRDGVDANGEIILSISPWNSISLEFGTPIYVCYGVYVEIDVPDVTELIIRYIPLKP